MTEPVRFLEVFGAGRVDIFAVACPRCEAAVDKPCASAYGLNKLRIWPHPVRVTLACDSKERQ